MDADLRAWMTRIEDKLDRLVPDHEKVTDHHKSLYGEGRDNPGLILTVDRMRIEAQYWHWCLGVVITATSIPLGEKLWHSLIVWLS